MKTIYHASFDIGNKEAKPNLDKVLKVIDEWASRRTNACINFSQLNEETHLDFPEASLDVVKLSRGDTSLASLVLKHEDREDKEFQWSADVRLRDQKNTPHKISITVSNGWSGVALRPEIEYKVSRPAVVPMLIDALDCYNFKHLLTHPEVLSRENVSSLVDALYSRRRTLPIILITRDPITERPVVNPFEIAKSVAGLAHVYYCKDKFVQFRIEESIGKSMSCYDGGVRTYWPINEKGTDPSFHPLITAQRLKEDEERARNISTELLEMLAKESISRAVEVSPEEIHEMRLKLRAEVLTGIKDYEELAELYADDNTRLTTENGELKKTEEALKQQIKTLEAKVQGLQASFDKSEIKDEDEKLTDTSFKTVKKAVNRIKEIYSEDQLVILGRADKGAKDSLYEKPEVVFKVLEWLATTYRSTRKGELKKDLAQSCMEQTGLQYRAHQSKITMSTFESEYYANYNGKKIPLNEHLRKGTSKDPRHTLSVAFFYDAEKEKVVVGFIGQHQTTKTT